MNGTNRSTPGLGRITRWDRPLRFRLLMFGAILLLGALVITWIKTNTWKQVEQLHDDLANIQMNRFDFAIRFSAALRDLNDTALACCLQPNATNRDNFLRMAQELGQLLAKEKASHTNPVERPLLKKLEELDVSYDTYRTNVEPLLMAAQVPLEAESFGSIHTQLEDQIRPVLAKLNDWMKAQNEAFDGLVQASQGALLDLLKPLKLSAILLWGLAAFLAALGYRGMIAPLLTRLDQSRATIVRQEKLASLGVLASGVAHEIRNPLTAIKFRLFSLNQSLPQVTDNEDAKVINAEIDRLDRIVKDFLQFARPSEPKLVSLPGERMLQQVRDLLKPYLDKQAIRLEMEPSGPTWVQADPQQIEQVLINLVQNSADSIGHNGSVTLGIREGNAGLGGRTRPVVILVVTDTGKGIPPEVEKRLFDPFFTTKDGGTGLGLAIAARIIEKHGGVLRHNTRLNQGTTFEIVLPKSEPNAT